MRLIYVVAGVAALAACQGSAEAPSPSTTAVPPAPAPAPPPPSQPPAWGVPVPEPTVDAGAAPTAHEITPTALPAASHGRSIVAVAITDDGTAALTLDNGAGVRLWPSLDGTREPIAVPLVAPEEMVIARDADGFAIGALDTAGGLTVLRVDASGKLVGKASLPFDQPYLQIVATADGYIATRSDQTIERIDRKGTSLGEVRPEMGQRIANLVARRGRVLAMLADPDHVVGRWLDTRAGLAWGDTTPDLAIDPKTATLSPDHTRLAALEKKTRKAALVELASGTVTPVRGSRRDLVPLGWPADDRVAFVHDEFELSRVEWFDATGKAVSRIGDDFELEFLSVLGMEAADERVVAFQGAQLVLVAPRKLRYLGYALHAASRLRSSPAGIVAALGGSSEILDDDLQIERRVPTANARDLLPIDDTFAVAIRGKPMADGPFDDALVNPKKKQSGVEVVLFEGDTKQQTLKMQVTEMKLRYEPSTHLLAVNSGDKVTFARFDPATKRFGDPIAIRVASRVRDIVLLDPSLANGAIALVVHGAKGELVVRPIHDDELAATPALPHEATALPGELEAVDRAGHVYIRRDADTVSIHAGAQELGRLTDMTNMSVRPAPDGRRVALFGRGRILLANLDTTPRWSIGFPGVKDLQWTDGELVALSNGIAKLDPETGHTIAARCGWKFGLRNQASFVDLPGSTICDR